MSSFSLQTIIGANVSFLDYSSSRKKTVKIILFFLFGVISLNGCGRMDMSITKTGESELSVGSDVIGANGSLKFSIPAASYDGKQYCIAADSNLLASNIRSGVSLFGTTGTFTSTSVYADCVDNALNANQCSTAANRYVTSISGNNVTGSNGSLVLTIPSGFYDGAKTTTASDTNLIATNIKSGTTIFGVTGNLTAAYSACSDNSLNASACSTAANRYVTGTSGANISGANGSLSMAISQGFYSGVQTATASDSNLTAANIKSGVSIFGTTGTFTLSFSELSNSDAIRNKASSPITHYQEAITYGGSTSLPANYRLIPSTTNLYLATYPYKDDDGFKGTGTANREDDTKGSVIYPHNSNFGNTTCGTSGATIDARIADCATVFGSESTWDGTTKGLGGNGVWKLVTNVSASVEVWRDEKTKLLWSSVVTFNTNWCKASGNSEASEVYCGNNTYQNQTTPESVCAEIPTMSAGYRTSAAKGNLNLSSTPAVTWRLPTKNDFLQAEVDGIRYVISDMYGSANYWTATIYGSNTFNAWTWFSPYGEVGSSVRTTNLYVRCVGK